MMAIALEAVLLQMLPQKVGCELVWNVIWRTGTLCMLSVQ